jgi:hypothetical protein
MNSPALLLLALLSLLARPAVADDKLPRVAETFEIKERTEIHRPPRVG